MKYRYSSVNDRLISSETEDLVLEQLLGKSFIYRMAELNEFSDTEYSILELFKEAENAGISCVYNPGSILEMLEKFLKINSRPESPVFIVIAEGKNPVLFIGHDISFFRNGKTSN